jgi:catalase
LHSDDDDFGQAGTLYRDVMSDGDRANLASNLIDHIGDGVDHDIQVRAVEGWYRVDAQLGAKIASGLGLSSPGANGTLTSTEHASA